MLSSSQKSMLPRVALLSLVLGSNGLLLKSPFSFRCPFQRIDTKQPLKVTLSIPELDKSTANSFQALERIDLSFTSPSTLRNKAIDTYLSPNGEKQAFPTLAEVKSAIPQECFKRDTMKSLSYAAFDVLATSFCAAIGAKLLLPIIHSPVVLSVLSVAIPSVLVKAVLYSLYALVTGTVAIGMWVTAHECGHGAFSDDRRLQDFVGYLFHSLLLVPYYSWARSHAVHHANTNHIDDGETHVPPIISSNKKLSALSGLKDSLGRIFGRNLGGSLFGGLELVKHLVFGWPAYLLFGATGGRSRGVTNHFIPYSLSKLRDSSKELFPKQQKAKVWASDIGIIAVLTGLATLVNKIGFASMMVLYGGPMMVVNAWLVLYTWLQHTETDVPHLPADDFNFIKGAFLTIDRPYDKLLGGVIDFLHHKIGTTHVVHHIDSTIPHYNAEKATEAVKKAFPQYYLEETTPIFKALWRIALKCYEVEPQRDSSSGKLLYLFVDKANLQSKANAIA